MYQYDPEAYRQLYHERMAELRRDYQEAPGRRRSSAAERCVQYVRSVRLCLPWRSPRRAPIAHESGFATRRPARPGDPVVEVATPERPL